jgi:hypothetical protein
MSQSADYDAPRTTRPTADIPAGTPVLAFPATRDDRALVTRTRSEVWRAGSFDLVSVEGYAGGIALSHIEVLPTRVLSPASGDPR